MTPAAAWLRVSAGHQDSDNQVPDVERFASHHGYAIAERYVVSDTAWKNGGGAEYKRTLGRALDDAHAGKFGVLIVWALDRIVREGAEDALRIFRQFRQRGCIVVSVKESWLNGSPEVQDILIAFAGWMAEQESRRRSERIRAGLARRRAEGLPVGRQLGAADKKQRRRSGYVARWERERTKATPATAEPTPAAWLQWRASLPTLPADRLSRAEMRNALVAAQQDRCALCLAGGKPLEVDHDGATGYVRGLLCKRCNGQTGKHESGLFQTRSEVIALYLANPPASGVRWLWEPPRPERPTTNHAISALAKAELPPL